MARFSMTSSWVRATGTLLAAIGLAKLHGDALARKISNQRREFARRGRWLRGSS
jgi:hypothetical protein